MTNPTGNNTYVAERMSVRRRINEIAKMVDAGLEIVPAAKLKQLFQELEDKLHNACSKNWETFIYTVAHPEMRDIQQKLVEKDAWE